MVAETRARQREATRQRIAQHAAGLFGERGFDRTSVRDVAAAAGVDPALVLHYYGSKRALFQHVMGDPAPAAGLEIGDPIAYVLDSLVAKLDDRAAAALAQLRSMLTNEDARDHARTQLDTIAGLLAAELDGDHPQARAHLLLATSLGIAIARELLRVEPLTDLEPAEIADLLRPAVAGLVSG